MAVKALLGGSLTTLVLMVVACQSPDPVVEDAPAVLSTSEVTKNHSGNLIDSLSNETNLGTRMGAVTILNLF